MGTDIHMFAQMKVDGKFQAIDPRLVKMSRDRCDDSYKSMQFSITRNYALFGRLAGIRTADYTPIAKPLKRLPNGTCKEIKKEKREYGVDGHSLHILYLSDVLPLNIKKEIFEFEDDMSYFEYEYWKKKNFLSLSYKFPDFYQENKLISEQEMKKLIEMINFHNGRPKVYCKAKYQFSGSEVYGKDFIKMVDELQKLKVDPKDIQLVFWFDS